MEIIVGIDLGTTNSEIAIVRDGKPEVLLVAGEPIMPSAVGIDPNGAVIVGKAAKNQMVSHPESTILSIKRSMGSDIRVSLGTRELSPEEVSSLILRELKQQAEKVLGTAVAKAVITVPAYFTERQRQATKDAGALAGLDVVRIINEPTAAALAYESGHEENQTVLVYDLGGGTFDASLVVVENGVVEVKSSHGDTKLGGDDFDNLLIEFVSDEFLNQHGVDLRADARTRRRLWIACEKAKRTLSDHPFASINEEYIHGDFHLRIEISREQYEAMITPHLTRARDCVHQCLRDASMLPGAVDKVILVGGSSRTPLVHRMLEEDFGRAPHHGVNPDLIVAMGAAIQAGALAGQPASAVLVDITPYTFGTSAVGNYEGEMRPGVFVPVIHRNTPLPACKSEVFYTMQDGQDAVDVEIYQGENPLCEENILIGEFRVGGLSNVPSGNEILLTLDLNVNGMLHVTAKEKKTGLKKSVTMDTRNRRANINLSEARENIRALVGPDENMLQTQRPDNSNESGKSEQIARSKELRRRAEKLLPSVSEDDAAEMRTLLDGIGKAIAGSNLVDLEELNESLSDMIFYLED